MRKPGNRRSGERHHVRRVDEDQQSDGCEYAFGISDDSNVLRAPVPKNHTFSGKGRKFVFFHILMLDRLGYNLNHCMVFSVK